MPSALEKEEGAVFGSFVEGTGKLTQKIWYIYSNTLRSMKGKQNKQCCIDS